VTPEDIALLQETVASISEQADEVVADFYRRLFERIPEARAMFPEDLTEQREKFFDTLTEIVTSLHDLSAVASTAHEMGSQHRTYGVHAHHYSALGDALIEAMAAGLGERFTERHHEAWTRGYHLVAELMQQGGAAQARLTKLSDRPH
jgi:hemoglobin-like flavoprotein